MKTTICCLLTSATLALAACNSQPADKDMTEKDTTGATVSTNNADEAKEERNKRIALESVEAINSHDVNTVLKDVAPDAVDYGDGMMPPVRSKDSVTTMISAWLKAFPDAKGSNLKAVADGDWVVVWGDWSGTWKSDFMGQKANNKSYKTREADIFRFNNEGKIIEHHNASTWYAVAAQTGLKMQ
jgi:predicted ester cyclase